MRSKLPSLLRAAAALLLVLASHGLSAQEQTWRINLKEAEIGEFITQVSRITQRSFVVDPRVQGRVTVISSAALDADGVYELFLSVLRVHGFAAVPAGDVIKIVQQTLAKQSSSGSDFDPTVDGELIVTRVIPADNVPASELVKIIRPLIPQYGHIASVDEPNVVILSDHAENIRRMEAIIREIDVADDEEVIVVPLRDAWVDNMVALLEALAPEWVGSSVAGPLAVQVVANERNNSLVLRGNAAQLLKLRTLIEELDQPASNTGSTRVFRLRHGDAEQMATILDGIVAQDAGNDGGPVETSIQADTNLNALVVRADPSVMAEIARIVRELDVRRTQVLIEAAIVEISITDNRDVGVDIVAGDRGGETTPLIVSPLGRALSSLIPDDPTDPDAGFDLFDTAANVSSPTVAVARISDNFSFAAIIQALETNSDANLLSTPSILTLDNEEAKIVVGQNVPFRTGSFTSTNNGADNPFTTIQREDVGITLKVIPHISDGEVVRLEVEQEVSSVEESANVGDQAFSDIVTNQRTIETTILADDGQTIVLGGLIQDDLQESERRVPVLGSMPVLGALFRSRSTEQVKRNLLVFLRPTVLKGPEDVARVTERKYDGVWEVQLSGDEAQEGDGEGADQESRGLDALYDGRPRPRP